MNNPNNLLSMMQTGGLTSTAGGAAFARVMQRRSDDKKLARQQRREARRQKKGRLFGSIAGLAGQGLGFLIGGSAGAAAGKALGTGLGQSLGAGKAEKYSRAGTVFNQDAFRDVSDASRDYNRGILGRSLLAGGEALVASALSPGGLKGAPRKGVASTGTLGLSQPPSLALDPSSALSSGTFGDISPSLSGSLLGSTSALSEGTLNAIAPSTFTIPSFIPSAPSAVNIPNVPSNTSFGVGSSQIGYNQPLLDLFEDGGLAGYQTGGFTAQGVLNQNLLDPTNQQLKLFQSFDPTQIQQAKTGAEQSLMSMTGGMGLSSAGGGFGAKQRATTSAIGAGQDMIGDVTEQASKDYESQVLGTAADLVAGGAEFGELAPTDQSQSQLYGVNEGDQTQMDEVTQFLQTYQGVDEININGNLHQWNPYSNPPTYRPV
tara:strand:+ start:1739 stop:3031 length:1293 start_codon:yes stop_codon:yes gene_type:complete